MRNHLSVLMLFVRSTLYQFLLIIAAMAAVESVLFALAIRKTSSYYSMDKVLWASHPEYVFGACFLLLCVVLVLSGSELGSREGYTLHRLRIPPRMVFVWQGVNNLGLLILFIAVQIGIALAFCGILSIQHPAQQATMLTYYANGFLHSLLPLHEVTRILRNVMLVLSLAVTSASFPLQLRKGEKPIAFILVAICAIVFFSRDAGSTEADAIVFGFALFAAAHTAQKAWKGAGDEKLS